MKITILVTRPPPAGPLLCEAIAASGDAAIYFPTIAFADQQLTDKELSTVPEQAWLIFLSPHAVQAFTSQALSSWPTLQSRVKFAAVGAATKQALYAAGIEKVVCPEQSWQTEGLLALPEFQSVKLTKIAIVCGADGRKLLAETLTARGAAVQQMIVYRRVIPSLDVEVLREQPFSAIVAGSFDSVKNLQTLLKSTLKDLSLKPLIVPSERIKTLAQDLGFQTIWVAKHAGNEAFLELIAQKRKEIWQMKL